MFILVCCCGGDESQSESKSFFWRWSTLLRWRRETTRWNRVNRSLSLPPRQGLIGVVTKLISISNCWLVSLRSSGSAIEMKLISTLIKSRQSNWLNCRRVWGNWFPQPSKWWEFFHHFPPLFSFKEKIDSIKFDCIELDSMKGMIFFSFSLKPRWKYPSWKLSIFLEESMYALNNNLIIERWVRNSLTVLSPCYFAGFFFFSRLYFVVRVVFEKDWWIRWTELVYLSPLLQPFAKDGCKGKGREKERERERKERERERWREFRQSDSYTVAVL